MTRGAIRPTTRLEAVARARSLVDGALLPRPPGCPPDEPLRPLRYRLEAGHNGGADPFALHPGSPSYGNRTWTADCVGFVAWCLGLDRYQPGHFPSRGGWFNTDSAIKDADTDREFFEPVGGAPSPGDIVVYGSLYAAGVRLKVGHIGLVVESSLDPWAARIIDCSAGQDRKLGHAVTERPNASVWAKRGRFLRYVKAAP